MKSIPCGFRHDVIKSERGETACCELLKRVIAEPSGLVSRVDRSACEYCFGDGRVHPERMSQVLGSAILAASVDLSPCPSKGERVDGNANTAINQCLHDKDAAAVQLKQVAERAIAELAVADPGKRPSLDRVSAVDVVMLVGSADHSTQPPLASGNTLCVETQSIENQCMEAWLGQRDVYVVLHLVGIGEGSLNRWQHYVSNPNVQMHEVMLSKLFDTELASSPHLRTRMMMATQAITEKLETPLIAFASDRMMPSPTHLARATAKIDGGGLDWYAASMRGATELKHSQFPNPKSWRRGVQLETAVIRRALWVDLNGMANRAKDADVDFFDRAARQRRRAFISSETVVTEVSLNAEMQVMETPPVSGQLGDPPPRFRRELEVNEFSLHKEGIGFECRNLACDVVLPFRGQLEFVQQAIDSILGQAGIAVTLHLIDDDTQQDIDGWLRQFLGDDRIRVYRNSKNIGQFLSFNNAAEFFETEWAVTQDGDDVSLPGRLAETVRIAKLCNADLVGAATVLQGPIEGLKRLKHVRTMCGDQEQYHRISFPPRPSLNAYFLENPTLVHRRAFFERMGGFADFADPLRNRTTVDSEYMLRSLHAGANIVACRRLAVMYRVHSASAIHDEKTRMGSPIRTWVEKESIRRLALFRRGGIDARVFGSLGRHRGITRRWNG